MHFSCRFDINLTKLMKRKMKVNGTGSRSMLEEYAKDNYNARFHTATRYVQKVRGLLLKCHFPLSELYRNW